MMHWHFCVILPKKVFGFLMLELNYRAALTRSSGNACVWIGYLWLYSNLIHHLRFQCVKESKRLLYLLSELLAATTAAIVHCLLIRPQLAGMSVPVCSILGASSSLRQLLHQRWRNCSYKSLCEDGRWAWSACCLSCESNDWQETILLKKQHRLSKWRWWASVCKKMFRPCKYRHRFLCFVVI